MKTKFIIPFLLFQLLFVNALLARSQTTLDYKNRIHPEIAEDFMVVSQNSHATEAGYEILRKGGNAVDAAVAVGFALAVTLPRAGNLGGGGFMLIFDKKENKVSTIDYRSASPKSARSEMFIKDSNVVRFGHLVNAVPGSVAGLLKAHDGHGKLNLRQVLRPAIELAEKGFPVTYDLNYALTWSKESMLSNSASTSKFYQGKEEPIEVSKNFKQPKLANTLMLISRKGREAFYEGEVAKWISEESLSRGGLITLEDLSSYEAKSREPISIDYRGYKIVSMPPAASGGLVLLQILNILENFDIPSLGHNSARTIHLLSESMQRAYADRATYHGDPDFFDVPTTELLNKGYALKRANSISSQRTEDGQIFSGDLTKIDESPDTTHFSVLDSEGNAVSNTYTLGSSFGSGVTIEKAGFLMNNQMRNFSHFYGKSNEVSLKTSEANRLEPGKRMISTQTPTLVFNPKGDLIMVLGSPGGGRIPNIIAQVISNVIDHKMSYSEAVLSPRINQRLEGNLELESGFSPDTIELLEGRGHEVKSSNTMGSVQAIFVEGDLIYGVADTRRPGALAKGD
ncbi:MAG TPA: gamma-glutamyltransferase [SAR86 cluster bacterium]|nr:gamma-glutamyltransferase [SAR86 cluster bacterium]|tara:strand:+ start:3350 stop:5056 length:1707 start_codon:yes stop_codon:yes gene_type:complete